MKIFAVYLKINLTERPDWFDEFRSLYSPRSILHITLVQPRYIQENDIESVKEKVAQVLSEFVFTEDDKKIIFDATDIEKDADGDSSFLWFIQENKLIVNLQKRLVEELKNFSKYCNEVTKQYESNFKPHMTVTDAIQNRAEVVELLSRDQKCAGVLTELALPIVKDKSIEETENPKNILLFKL